MVKKNKKSENAEEVEDLEEAVDMDLVATQMKFPRGQLRKLRIESAMTGKSMASILRGLLDSHLAVDDEKRELVEDNLYDILESCQGLLGGFEIDYEEGFVYKMSVEGISLSDLNADEWETVLSSLETGFRGYGGGVSADVFVNKFVGLKPSRSQKRDLRQLARRILKE